MRFRRRPRHLSDRLRGGPQIAFEHSRLETSVGLFEVSPGLAIGLDDAFLRIAVYEVRDGVRWDDLHWDEVVANVGDVTILLVFAGIPEDEAEVAARRVFSDAVHWVREAWPGYDPQVDPDEPFAT